jgi:GMP synthase-like glutamine amidotransferase
VRAVLIANFDERDLGLVGIALRTRGYRFDELLREEWANWTAGPTSVLDDCDLVVSLGSAWSTYWPDVQNAVAAEVLLIQEADRRGIPFLGICFGAQMLSTAFGGTVDKAPSPEVGWHLIRVRTDIDARLPEGIEGPWMQWHYDRFHAPEGFFVAADSPSGPQIIYARRCVGLQFHPEATESIVARWSDGSGRDELQALDIEAEELFARTAAEMPAAMARCELLLEWFFDVTQ